MNLLSMRAELGSPSGILGSGGEGRKEHHCRSGKSEVLNGGSQETIVALWGCLGQGKAVLNPVEIALEFP